MSAFALFDRSSDVADQVATQKSKRSLVRIAVVRVAYLLEIALKTNWVPF